MPRRRLFLSLLLQAVLVLPPIAAKIELQGVFPTEKGLAAVINGAVREQGDWFRIDGFEQSVRVLEVAEDSVLLEHAQTRFRRSLADTPAQAPGPDDPEEPGTIAPSDDDA